MPTAILTTKREYLVEIDFDQRWGQPVYVSSSIELKKWNAHLGRWDSDWRAISLGILNSILPDWRERVVEPEANFDVPSLESLNRSLLRRYA